MPNQRLNKVVKSIDQGVISYQFLSPPHKIVDVGSMWRLKSPSYSVGKGEKLIAEGYRHCPSHWEWVLMIRHYEDAPWLDAIRKEFSDGGGGVMEIMPACMRAPAINIVREPNDMPNKGGMPNQVSVYLESSEQRFLWTPSVGQIMAQLRLAFGLYGWDGLAGLKAEIFDRI